MRSARLVPVLVLTLAAACTVYDPLYCEADRDCDDPERPFCDVDGVYPASDGIKRTCIADPMPAAPMPDFSIEVDAATVPVRVDGEATVAVTIARLEGFSEDIEIRAEGLPPGVTAVETTIGPDVDEAVLTIIGDQSAIGSKTAVVVVARASAIERTAAFDLLVLGQAGALDPTFGLLGVAAEPSTGVLGTDDATDLLAFPDGSLMVGGDSRTSGLGTLVKFRTDGSIDESFGPMGSRNFDCTRIGLIPEPHFRYAQQSTTGIVFATADREGDYALGRFDADGDLDTEFRDGGLFRVATLSPVSISRVAIGPTDEILVAMTRDSSDIVWINRFTPDGMRDGGFAGGRAEIDLGDFHQVLSMSVFEDGSVLGTATARVDEVIRSFVFKLTAQGALDVDFAEGGILQLPQGEIVRAGIGISGGGALLAGEVTPDGGLRTPALWRLDDRGELVRSFGDGGRVLISLPGDRTGAVRSVIAVDDARFLALGDPGITSIMGSVMDGSLDASFGEDGISITAFDDPIAAVSAVLLPDGRFAVLADNDSLGLALARFFL